MCVKTCVAKVLKSLCVLYPRHLTPLVSRLEALREKSMCVRETHTGTICAVTSA